MCDCIEFDSINGSNADNDYSSYSEKVVKQLKTFKTNDKLLDSLSAPTAQLRNGSKICDNSVIVSDSETKCKGIVVSIDSMISGPTIDDVLDKVPLVYDPITKQLLLHKSFSNNNGLNGYKNGINLKNGFKKVNGFSNLNKSSTESTNQLKCFDEYSTQINVNNSSVDSNDCEDNCHELDANKQSVVESKQSPNDWSEFERRTESHSEDNNELLSVFETNKDSLIETNEEQHDLSATNGDNVSNVDSSVSSLNLDDTESTTGSVSDPKPKKLFTLSIQSILNKVKRNANTNHTNHTNSNNNTSNTFATNCVNISSTRALILETRPPSLPAKPEDEQKKHKLEFEEMIRQSRKRELKEMKAKKKLMERQRKQEEQVIEAIRVWNTEILPNWPKCRSTKRTRDLWWAGIPSMARQKVWTLAISNELNITEEIYRQCVSRSKEKVWTKSSDECCGESAADLISLDVSRTFPQLGLFQESGPYHEVLSELLGAYVTYRPDMGYSQGMSFLAAMLLLNMESSDAFSCFANLLNNQLLVAFFRVNQTVMNAYYQTYEEFFRENLPKLHKHFNEHKLSPDLYLVDYIYTLFSRSLPLDIASRIWDLFLRDGDQFIFRAALGILSMYYEVLLNLDFIYLAQFLTKLPEDIDSHKLFTYIAGIRMTIGCEKQTFSSVLSSKLLDNFRTKDKLIYILVLD